MDIKKIALVGVGALGILVSALFIKNVISEKDVKELSKEEVVKLLKQIRRERYLLYKQIATFAVNIKRELKNNINQQTIQQFINGPESPIKFAEEVERIDNDICAKNNVPYDDFVTSLEKLNKDPDVNQLLQQQQLDYNSSLGGALPNYNVKVPETLTKEKYYQLLNQVTKSMYMHQVRVLKKVHEHSEIEIQQNPSLIKDLGNPDAANEQMLRGEELGSEYEPATAVFQAASLQFRNQPDFRTKVQQIEGGYQKILMKYIPRIQNKSITAAELNQMEDQIIYFEPI